MTAALMARTSGWPYRISTMAWTSAISLSGSLLRHTEERVRQKNNCNQKKTARGKGLHRAVRFSTVEWPGYGLPGAASPVFGSAGVAALAAMGFAGSAGVAALAAMGFAASAP